MVCTHASMPFTRREGEEMGQVNNQHILFGKSEKDDRASNSGVITSLALSTANNLLIVSIALLISFKIPLNNLPLSAMTTCPQECHRDRHA
jgi:hypothetical protein